MSSQEPILLLTRPAPSSEQTRNAVESRLGFSVHTVISPVLRIVPLDPRLPAGPHVAVILTSVEAVRAMPDEIPALPAYCVGARTAEAARAAGLVPYLVAPNAAALTEALLESPPAGRVLYLRGVHVAGDLVARLGEVGRAVDEVLVYDQEAVPLNDEALDALAGRAPVVMPLFSARTAEIVAADGPFAAPLHVVAMSQPVARMAAAFAPTTIDISEAPDGGTIAATVAAILRELCDPAPLA